MEPPWQTIQLVIPTYSPTLNSRCSKILLLCISRALWVRSRFLCLFVSILMRNNRGMADKPQNHYRTLRIYPSSCSPSPFPSSSPFHSHTLRSTIRRRIAHRRRTAAGARRKKKSETTRISVSTSKEWDPASEEAVRRIVRNVLIEIMGGG